MSKVLRVGVLGQGRSGHDIHVAYLRQAPDRYQVVAVADQMPERWEARDQLGAKAYSDYRDLLKDRSLALDLVVNALPSYLHPKANIEALNMGYHIVGEKPAARTVKDFDRVVQAAKKSRRHYFPFQNSRFYPFFAKMREVIDSGKLGKIVYIRSNWSGFARRWDWQTHQEYWGGNLLNTGPHPMDQAIVLFGGKAPKVFARLVSENPFGDAENFVMVTLYGKGAPTIEIMINSFQAYPQGEQYNVCGTLGGLTASPKEMKWKYFDPAKAPDHEFKGEWSDKRQYCREPLEWIEESWTAPAGGESFDILSKGFYDEVYNVMVNGAKPVITHSQVRRQIAVMEECHRQNKMARKKKHFLR